VCGEHERIFKQEQSGLGDSYWDSAYPITIDVPRTKGIMNRCRMVNKHGPYQYAQSYVYLNIAFVLVSISLLSNSCTNPTNKTTTTTNDKQTCDPSEVQQWLSQTSYQRQMLDDDFDQMNASNPDSFDDYVPYAERAKARYYSILYQSPPSCLDDIKELVLEEAHLFWKGLEATSNGNTKSAVEHMGRLVVISSQVDEAMIKAIAFTKPESLDESSTEYIQVPTNDPIDVINTPHVTDSLEMLENQLFWDDFEDEQFSKSRWSTLGGKWEIINGKYICLEGGKSIAGDPSWTDYSFKVSVLGKSVINKIVVFRFNGNDHHYGINLRSYPYNDLVLVKSIPGKSPEILHSSTLPNYNDAWYFLEITVEGNSTVILVNDEEIISYIDNDEPILKGRIGLGAMLGSTPESMVVFDNVEVTSSD